jgi:hypothetical protein
MLPINNSDTAWLIVADWNQDNGKFHEELMEDVLEPAINNWYYKNGMNLLENPLLDSTIDVGGFACGVRVGNDMCSSGHVGSVATYRSFSGEAHDIGDDVPRGRLVGGNE